MGIYKPRYVIHLFNSFIQIHNNNNTHKHLFFTDSLSVLDSTNPPIFFFCFSEKSKKKALASNNNNKTTKTKTKTTPLLDMIVSQKMVADADMNYQPPTQKMVLDVNYHHLCVAASADVAQPSSSSSSSPSFRDVHRVSESMSADISRFEPVMSCSDTANDAAIESAASLFVPNIRSGSYAEIGPRDSMDDEHIRIDDLSAQMDSFFKFPVPSAFYAVFDGHGGPEAAAYIKRHAMRLFFEDADLPQTSEINAVFLKELENSHRKAFKQADLALADERSSVKSSCGTTALTALILGRHLLVANAGDCRAVLCRKGVAVAMSQDHKPTYLPERKRVEGLGGYVQDIYLNGYLSVTRALGDWEFKSPLGPASPLIAEPDVQQVALSEDDEFLIIGCDGLWDVVNSQSAVSLVRRALRRHGDPQECARELVMEALRLYSSDNITVIVICLSAQKFDRAVETCPRPRRWRPPCLSEESRNRLRSLLEGN